MAGFLAGGENAAAPLDHGGHVQTFKKDDQFRLEKAVKHLSQKFAAGIEMLQRFPDWVRVGQVATPLAGEEQFTTGRFHLFKQDDAPARFRRLSGGHQSGRAAADNNDFAPAHSDSARSISIVSTA